MLTALEFENFKGFSLRQRIEFAPLTLLFGANSAGKSSILQAAIYFHELLEHGDADVDRTSLGGAMLELGGFARLVHRHDSARTMVLRAEFQTPGELHRSSQNLDSFPFSDLDDEIKAAWIEVSIQQRLNRYHRGPVVARARIGVGRDPEPLVWLDLGPSCRPNEPLYARVNLGHPMLGESAREVAGLWEEVALDDRMLALLRERERGERDEDQEAPDDWFGGDIYSDGRALPVFALSRTRLAALPALDEPLSVLPATDDEFTGQQAAALDEVRTFLELTVVGTTAKLAAALRKALYIGPLRSVPPRGFLFERAGRITRWSDGLAAWDLLLSDHGALVENTNDWLDRFEAGCQVVVQQLIDAKASAEDLSEGHVDSTVRRLQLSTSSRTLVLPAEVGSGISQMVPIIVAAVAEGIRGLVLIEQPEIHVHPALQVCLGDLLIEGSITRTFVVETHSEHLILRLLRRIRETSDGELPVGKPAFSPERLCVHYVESTPDGARVRRLGVGAQGEFTDSWPKGFFDERFAEIYSQ